METHAEPIELGSPEDVARYRMRGLMGMSRALIDADFDDREVLPGMNPDVIVAEVLNRIAAGDPDEMRVLKNRLDIISRVTSTISFDWVKRLGTIKRALRDRGPLN